MYLKITAIPQNTKNLQITNKLCNRVSKHFQSGDVLKEENFTTPILSDYRSLEIN